MVKYLTPKFSIKTMLLMTVIVALATELALEHRNLKRAEKQVEAMQFMCKKFIELRRPDHYNAGDQIMGLAGEYILKAGNGHGIDWDQDGVLEINIPAKTRRAIP